jgi:hypothetical protein
MPTPLHAKIDAIAKTFAASIIAAIRAGTLNDLLAQSQAGTGGREGLRPSTKATAAKHTRTASPKRTAARTVPGRLPRRSAADVARVLDQVVALVKKRPGLRAEAIRVQLGLDVREVPRVLTEGLETKRLTKKGQKRATEYFAK